MACELTLVADTQVPVVPSETDSSKIVRFAANPSSLALFFHPTA